jgi:hypothetical protein
MDLNELKHRAAARSLAITKERERSGDSGKSGPPVPKSSGPRLTLLQRNQHGKREARDRRGMLQTKRGGIAQLKITLQPLNTGAAEDGMFWPVFILQNPRGLSY